MLALYCRDVKWLGNGLWVLFVSDVIVLEVMFCAEGLQGLKGLWGSWGSWGVGSVRVWR